MTHFARTGSSTTIALLLALFTLAGCASELAPDSPLSNARRSPEALAEAALEAIRAQDEEAVAALMVTRDEYETLLWPSLPDRNSVSFDFVWGMSAPRSRKARREALQDYGGLPLEVVRVDPGDDTEVYDDFTLYMDAELIVRRTDTGQEGRMPMMNVLVHMDGGWKFLNFREG